MKYWFIQVSNEYGLDRAHFGPFRHASYAVSALREANYTPRAFDWEFCRESADAEDMSGIIFKRRRGGQVYLAEVVHIDPPQSILSEERLSGDLPSCPFC